MKITLPDALHARPANLLVRAAAQLPCKVFVSKGSKRADAANILQVLGLGAQKGDEVELTAEGESSDVGLAAIVALVERNFDADLVPETGRSGAAGIAIGEALVLDEESDAAEQGGDAEARTTAAFARARDEVRALVDALPPHEAKLFEPELPILDALETAVRARLSSASPEDAVREETAIGATDLVADARARLLDALAGTSGARARKLEARAGREVVLVASNVTPSLVAALPRNVVGVIAAAEEEAAGTSHAAILARGRGLPLAFVPEHVAAAIEDGVTVVLDTTVDPARIWASPSEALVSEARAKKERRAADAAEAEAHAEAPLAIVAVRVNVGSRDEGVPRGAEGIGLVRSELLFADRTSAPREEEQATIYAAIAAKTSGPVNVRLFDAGGDKPLAFLPPPAGDPGARGIALVRAHPDILAAQLRAIARAGDRVRALLPLVRSADDVLAVRSLASLSIGAMIETPAAAEDIDAIAAVSDFVCIGTNDLAAETLGLSREQAPNPLDPRVLAHIRRTVEGAHARGLSVTVCGEIAADPRGARVLVGLGVDALSVSATRFAALKLGLFDATIDDCRRAAEAALSGAPNP